MISTRHIQPMALASSSVLQFRAFHLFGISSFPSTFLPLRTSNLPMKPLKIKAKANTRKESPKIRNRRLQKKFNGTPTKPRLSVFCSDKQLYATLVDDQNKKLLFYGSTLQESVRDDPSCTTIEAAEQVGKELVKRCIELSINEISSYDRNGLERGAKMQAFEIAISRHGFLP